MDKTKIKKVHVIFKTHLDIGFTDMGKAVLDRYVEEYIPDAIELGIQMNTEKEKRFIWTVGSYLIDYYLRQADQEAGDKLRAAIQRGDICWHGLAFTTHTELLDRELFEFNLSISENLDAQFNRKTISAKMTDVPGHTRAIVGPMADYGLSYLHIGVNPSSMVPEVPTTFRWKSGEREMVVQYSSDYGAPCYVDGMDEVLEFAHTNDNMGPQSSEVVRAELKRLKKAYPNAKIVASTMDCYAKSLLLFKESLPVVEEEIGDTWIHGIASDPLKVMWFRALIDLKNRWKAENRFGKGEEGYETFMLNLLLVAEHTWGLDFKTHLPDFTNWSKEDFQYVREGKGSNTYGKYERSHEEQREYLTKAVSALPDVLKSEVQKEFRCLEKQIDFEKDKPGKQLAPYEKTTIGVWTVSFDGSGTMNYLKKEGKEWIHTGCFGRLSYETYNAENCVQNYYSYSRAFRETRSWSELDFSKPGLEAVEDLKNRNYVFGLETISQNGSGITIRLKGNEYAVSKYGCPAEASLIYEFEEKIKVRLSWRQKDANRIPEALWFDVNFNVENPYRWQMIKMGEMISPFDVIRGGNRRHHCVEALSYRGADGSIFIHNVHSPLVSVGGRWMYGNYRELADITKGFSYNLFNNKWGTNFKMWCEDDCSFEYVVDIE